LISFPCTASRLIACSFLLVFSGFASFLLIILFSR
jgi:hypothetical protein